MEVVPGRPGRRTSASIEDVATRAGVSIATVSRALRGLPQVSEGTRQRVLAAAAELEYTVSPLAAGLASGKPRSVAVLTPSVGRWFFGEVLHSAAAVLGPRGYDISLYVVDTVQARRTFFSDLPPRGRAGAVLAVALPMSEHELTRLRSLRLPVVAVGYDSEELACVRGVVARQREQGYLDVLAENGLPADERWRANGHFTADGAELAMRQILDSGPPFPTAVFCQSDEMASGVVHLLRRLGVRVPEEMSVVGIDDHDLARLWDLTTVAQPVAEHGRVAAERLLAAVDGVDLPDAEHTVLPVRLVRRQSAGPVPQAAGEVDDDAWRSLEMRLTP